MSRPERKPELGTMPPLRQVLAANASPMTGPGTTTYLLGQGEVVVLDPGPALPAHLANILAALQPGERISHILVSHPHLDHSALVPQLQRATGAEVLGFGPAGSGRSLRMQQLAKAGLGGGEGVDWQFNPDRQLRGGTRLNLAGLAVEVVATPGHMAEHLAFGIGPALFCGDHVMAWAPSLVSPPDGDMQAYLASLETLRHSNVWESYWPSHGPMIANPLARIEAILAHRRGREAAILEALARGPLRCDDFLPLLYAEVDQMLWPAAARSILAHLVDLLDRQWIKAENWPSTEARFQLG